ncbi:MAG: glutamine--fructose-6-phosphate transaminase (isomerizing) [Candidatus Levybacteria bacterium]|nr:glutamine--fructose-6-phosphate transaminase (isomerizing) [Candidatus Levybacteria bacterium]MBI3069694.1 glutamine--fructose-6-phosphate transaminase (isomerizing) [Candidatus Levybacteria bacterium]MBI3092821.1 glutamine--fructose-6-phosphate transaminase (isomerizing) [Candidatus Levybacteria bacterium]
MCGIFGYVGKDNRAAQIVLEGLKTLEYRGYDSWGIASKIKNKQSLSLRDEKLKMKNSDKKNKFIVEKYIGKIENGISQLSPFSSQLVIGHTRWATHGGVTIANAHPHLDCTQKIAVVHNGIVENFEELREELIKKGHLFISETDTEVIPHLIEEYGKKQGFASSVRDAFNRLDGLNAIVAANSKSCEIIAAKTGSPLIIGIGENEFFIASDATGIIKHTRQVLFLKDLEMVILGKKLQLLSLPNGKKLTFKPEIIKWKTQDVSRGMYRHFMLKEIYEQPKAIRNITKNYGDQINHLVQIIEAAKGTFLIGAGTAFHACLAGTYLFSKIAHIHVNTAVASEFNYLEDFLNKKSLVIALSQSGETIDVVEPLKRAKEKGSKIIAITNVLGSTIYRMADYKMLLGAGPEKAVASTKAYVAKLVVLLMLSFKMVGKSKEIKAAMAKVADEVERLLEKENIEKIKKIASFLSSAVHIYSIGRGVSYSTALEAALKIKEVSYIHTEGLAGGELKHGTIALISKGTPCIVFTPNDQTHEAMISNATEIRSRGGVIIGISSKNSSVFDYWIEVRDIGEASVIPQIVPAQLLAYYLAVEKGYDPDKPRNLAKSVTVK